MNARHPTAAKIAILTGTRAEYGLFRPLLAKLSDEPGADLSLLVTGTHLAERFGATVAEVEADGYRIAARIPLPLDDDSERGVANDAAAALAGVAEALATARPDLLILLGDRYETLSGAIAAHLARVPVAHLHGGELSLGAADDAMRHAITKMAWLHFAATPRAARRIIQLGEEPQRVFTVGALGVDNALAMPKMTRLELEGELGHIFGPRTALITFHPVTLEGSGGEQIAALLAALERLPDLHIIFTMPNADAGNRVIAAALDDFCAHHSHRAHSFVSLGARRYLSLLELCDVCVGNSSSGIIEAPSLGTPSVDIGDRQAGRERGPSVLHCPPQADAVAARITAALSDHAKRIAEARENPYGDGNAAERIAAILRRELPNLGSLRKRFYDLPADAETILTSEP